MYDKKKSRFPFIGKADDGSIVRLVQRGDEWFTLAGEGARESRIQDTDEAREVIKRTLSRQGFSGQDANEWVEQFDARVEDDPLVLPDGQTFVKRPIPTLEPDLSRSKLVDSRLPVLIAYEFLALLIGNVIYQDDFDSTRQYIGEGVNSDRCVVQRLFSGKYAPTHTLYLEPKEKCFSIFMIFFGWLVFSVRFNNIKYFGPDAVYIEDLSKGRTFLARSRSDARAGKLYTS